jgi:uncharacterized membrane protein YraQ (UPF0718 family)
MTTEARAAPAKAPARVPLAGVAATFWAAIALILLARAKGLATIPAVTTLGVIFTSIVVEALPFILIGAVVSAAIAVWVPDRAFAGLARLPRAMQLPGAAIAGVAFPVCECGSVPVGRRLLARGIDPAAGIAFMLAAPILNPIVLASTWVAYQGRGKALEMTAARAGLGLLIAVAAGWVIAHFADGPILRSQPAAAGQGHSHEGGDSGERFGAFSRHLAADFFFMGRYLILGAAASALIQTVLPQSAISGLGGEPVLSALVMMGLAFALSLCSEADAFVAVSFTAFPLSSQLAFLVTGPMLDTKLSVLYGATFRRDFVPKLVAVTVPLALVGALLFQGLV